MAGLRAATLLSAASRWTYDHATPAPRLQSSARCSRVRASAGRRQAELARQNINGAERWSLVRTPICHNQGRRTSRSADLVGDRTCRQHQRRCRNHILRARSPVKVIYRLSRCRRRCRSPSCATRSTRHPVRRHSVCMSSGFALIKPGRHPLARSGGIIYRTCRP